MKILGKQRGSINDGQLFWSYFLVILGSLALIFAVVSWHNEKQQRKEAETALFELAWDQIVLPMENSESFLSETYFKIPADARPRFFMFIAGQTQNRIALGQKAMEEYVQGTQKEGIGINYLLYPLQEQASGQRRFGALVQWVVDGSPAARAGLCAGDIITANNGAELWLTENSDSQQEVKKSRKFLLANDPAELSITRTIAKKDAKSVIVSGRQQLYPVLPEAMAKWESVSRETRAKLVALVERAQKLAKERSSETLFDERELVFEFLRNIQILRDQERKFPETLQPEFAQCK